MRVCWVVVELKTDKESTDEKQVSFVEYFWRFEARTFLLVSFVHSAILLIANASTFISFA